ncbi:MAG: hypothetical protein GY769_13040 [bacterium]|nr:hypothetical protein [bacterium]
MKPNISWTVVVVSLVVLLGGLGVYESRIRSAALARELPTREAQWIWASDLDAEDGWVNFFVYRDFVLESGVPDRAELTIQADEGYWAFVNRQAAGSGGFRDGAPVDSYDVAEFLRPGANRLVVQLRSRRGVGGLLARLDLGEAGSVVTDGGWRMCRRYESALLGSGFVPEDIGTVKVWGVPPVGSWPVLPEVVRLPALGDQLLSSQTTDIFRFRALGQSEWVRRFPPPESRLPLGRWVIFDLGRVVHGYMNVVFAAHGGAQGLVYTSLDRPTGPDTADPATRFLSPVGRGSWTDPQPREFRFVTVVALAEIAGLRVFETAPEWVAERGAGEIRRRRAFGFQPPPSAATVEHEFWRELKRVTGLTGREAFESTLGG